MRSAAVSLGLTALMAASLTGCSSDEDDTADYAAICVNPETPGTHRRRQLPRRPGVQRLGRRLLWFYMATRGGGFVPPIGGRFTPGSGTYSTGGLRSPGGGTATVQRGGLDTRGGNIGTIARGGFGKAGKGGSGG
jgi:hypothetical protein